MSELFGITTDGREVYILDDGDVVVSPQTGDDYILPYLHVSQQGSGAAENKNDCGSACAVSIVREHGYPDLTVDEVSATYQRPNQSMHINEVRAALGGYGVANAHQLPLRAVDIEQHIRDGAAVIALVAYPALPYHAPGYETYTWPHYVLCYGIKSGKILYHDPLSDGHELSISLAQMDVALRSGYGNMNYQGIVEVAPINKAV